MASHHKSEDFKLSAVEYYLVGDKSQLEVCRIFKCTPRSLMRWVDKYNNDGELKANITKVIKDIPKEKYKNIIKGTYNRTEKFIKNPSNRTRKKKNNL